MAIIENKTVQGVSAWFGIVGTGATVLTKLTPEWFGTLTWPQSLLLGMGLTIAAMFLVTASLALYRSFRPLPASSPVHPDLDAQVSPSGLTLEDVEAAFADRMESLHQAVSDVGGMFVERDEKAEKIVSIQSRLVSTFEERMAAIAADLAARKAEADNHHGRITELSTLQRKIIDDYQRMSAFADQAELDFKKIKATSENVANSFYAIYQRELLMNLADDIERYAAELYDQLHDGKSYDEQGWADWEKAHGAWDAVVRVWSDNARWYAPRVESRIQTVDDSLYSRGWSIKDGQFPDTETLSRSEAVRRFKKFRIIHEQWRKVREDVDRGVVQVAYIGLTERDTRMKPAQ